MEYILTNQPYGIERAPYINMNDGEEPNSHAKVQPRPGDDPAFVDL